jgi:carboxyl-terminal processing protease
MRKSVRRLAIVPATLLLALLSLAGDHAPWALRHLRAGDARAAVDPTKDKYDLASLDTFRKSVVQIKDNYVDPSRIQPKEMFVAALEAVERQVAEVMVETGGQGCVDSLTVREPGTAAPAQSVACRSADAKVPEGFARVTVGSRTRDFDYRDLDSIWQIPLKMREVFTFVKENLVTRTDQRDIEYAAVNGMLSTLDPHSWLLKPDLYKEMKVQTRGEFGGLGFVISMREDRLTVMKVLKNTPANKAGVRKGDVITQIDNDSTVSMDLQEAVDRMRGKPGTKVSIYVQHKGAESKRLDLQRALVTYETVLSKLLDNGIGYVRLSGFSGTTARDMNKAIEAMKAQNGGSIKGLVLDLRGNPGGLLEQAIQVSDAFVDEGTIVTTVGVNGTLREPKLARNDGHEKDFPMAVLISSESASASEIVAGALKNLNRAVIVGRQSFGKGSVQLLYDFKDRDSGDESALKLTIAQYLTPGDLSIQEVGITPDIELVPARILKDRIDLFAPPKTFREADYDKHFFNAFAHDEEGAKAARLRATSKPADSLRFVKEETAKERKNREALEAGQLPDDDVDSDDPSDEDGVTLDYQIEFCRDLLAQAKSTNRLEQLQQMKPYVEQRRGQEQEKVKKALEAMGLNWALPADKAEQGEAKSTGRVTAEVRAPRTTAGGTMDLTLTAHNTGKAPLYRVRAFTKSDNGVLDRREFVFGKLDPGEKRSWTVPVKIPRYMPSRRDDLLIKWDDDSGVAVDDLHAETDIAELPRPAFAWSMQLVNPSGAAPSDGLLHRGEQVELVVDVKNTGVGQAWDAYAALKNLAEDKINVKKGRTKLGPIKAGETRTATFLLEVKKGVEDAPVPVRLEIGDKELWEGQKEKILLPVGAPIPSSPSANAVKVQVETAVLASAVENAGKVATVKKGAVLVAKGKVGAFYRVEWEKGRTGFLPVGAAKEVSKAKPTPRLVSSVVQREPPFIRLGNLDPSRGGLEVDSDKFTLNGVAGDSNGMRDLQIFVQHDNDYRKVFFKTARKAGDLQSLAKPVQLDFSADLPLKPGNNTVFLIAREDDDLQTQRTVVIHRRQPALAQKQRAQR